MKGTIYLEPKETYDQAIIDQDNIIYSFTKIIEILMEDGMDWIDALDCYCFNIEPLIFQGLAVLDDDSEGVE